MSYFTDNELACKHCGLLKLHPGFRETLNALRGKFNEPMITRSCCRCKEHNDRPADEGGAGGHVRSLHVGDLPAHADKGQKGTLAIDIAAVDGAYRGRLFVMMYQEGWSIGWNAKSGFLHGDRRDFIGMQQTTFNY